MKTQNVLIGKKGKCKIRLLCALITVFARIPYNVHFFTVFVFSYFDAFHTKLFYAFDENRMHALFYVFGFHLSLAYCTHWTWIALNRFILSFVFVSAHFSVYCSIRCQCHTLFLIGLLYSCNTQRHSDVKLPMVTLPCAPVLQFVRAQFLIHNRWCSDKMDDYFIVRQRRELVQFGFPFFLHRFSLLSDEDSLILFPRVFCAFFLPFVLSMLFFAVSRQTIRIRLNAFSWSLLCLARRNVESIYEIPLLCDHCSAHTHTHTHISKILNETF